MKTDWSITFEPGSYTEIFTGSFYYVHFLTVIRVVISYRVSTSVTKAHFRDRNKRTTNSLDNALATLNPTATAVILRHWRFAAAPLGAKAPAAIE